MSKHSLDPIRKLIKQMADVLINIHNNDPANITGSDSSILIQCRSMLEIDPSAWGEKVLLSVYGNIFLGMSSILEDELYNTTAYTEFMQLYQNAVDAIQHEIGVLHVLAHACDESTSTH